MAETRVFNQPVTVTSRLTVGGGHVEVNPTVYTASGALTILPGKHLLSGAGPFAMTLAQPSAAQEGWVMTIYNDTPAAHTVVATGGFGGGGAPTDTATFGTPLAKNILTVMAVNLHWVIVGSTGIGIG